MKILQLNLLAFGPFTDTPIDLSEGKEGFHLVFGPNEAGKSSALRALRQMVFGIPERSTDNFRHPYAQMRIGGVLQHSDENFIEFIRRKGRANTLRSKNDTDVLDDSVLAKFIGDINVDLFVTMFGIGHEDLVRGGEEIIQGGGNVGQALFAAGSGISNLRKVQMELQAEAEALFKPTATTRRINEAIAELKKNEKGIKEAQLPGQEWERHYHALQAALTRKCDVDRYLEEKQTEQHRLERIKEALPLIARRKELLKELKTYVDAILLPEDFGERRQTLISDLRLVKNNKDLSIKSIEEVDKALGELEVIETLLENGELIEELYRELGSYQKAAKDRIQIMTKRDVLRGEAKEILSSLRDDLTLDETDKLRLKKSETVRIKELSTSYERLITKLENTREDSPRLSRHIEALDKVLVSLHTLRPVANLRRAIDQALKYGPLEDHYHSEYEQIISSKRSIEVALNKQTLWAGTLEELERLPLPLIETIDDFENRILDAQLIITQLRSEKKHLEGRVIDLERKIEEIQLEQDVPTENDLQQARQKREQGWQFILQAWKEQKETGKAFKEFVKSFEQAGTLSEAYEISVEVADNLADRLRREADRVAKKAAIIAERDTHKRQLEKMKGKFEEADAELDTINKEWLVAWEPTGISPRSPREMRTWVQNMNTLAEQASKTWQQQKEADDLNEAIQTCSQELSLCLKAIGEPQAEEDETLSDLIKRAQEVVAQEEGRKSKREQLLREKGQKEEERNSLELKIRTIEQDLAVWQKQWEEAVMPLGLDAEALPAQATAVLDDLKTLFDTLKEADILNKRIEGIDREADEFRTKVIELAKRIAEDVEKLPSEQIATELNARLIRSRTAKSQQESLEKQRRQVEYKLQDAEKRIADINLELEGMCEEAGCSGHEELPEAERRSSARRKMEEELEDLERQLRKLSGGAPVEAFIENANLVDPDSIDSQVDRLNEEIGQLGEEKSELDQTIGSERTELARMDGSARAAGLAEETQRIIARIESDVEQYARLRLASAVLAKAIERYREQHQGPVLKRTNKLFAHLTVGSFEGIRAEFNEQGTPVLVGVRPGGKELVGVEGMSDGTTDQLYFGLRLASLETYLEHNEPMPFIVDDILIKFDNERATAALQMLAELSGKTQVIFFTHHRHLVELAEANVDPTVLFKHSISI